MEKFDIEINRQSSHSGSIIGRMLANGKFICFTLELPWLSNERGKSCVPNGRYPGFLRYDKSDGWRIQLTGVPGRSGIQIHIGNYPRHTLGCVLVGTSYASNRVLGSAEAYRKLKEAFYGSKAPAQSPAKTINVEFRGIQAMPWGDYPDPAAETDTA